MCDPATGTTRAQEIDGARRAILVFLVADERDFEKEKQVFIENIMATQEKGYGFFDGKTSVSFGPLSGTEWNNMFYKHIDHHFMQFGI